MTTNNALLIIFLIYITGYIFCYYFLFLFDYLSNKKYRDLVYSKKAREDRFFMSLFWFIVIPFVICGVSFDYYNKSSFPQKLENLKNKILNSQSKWF